MTDLIKLKSELEEELKKEPLCFDKVHALSLQIVSLDKENVRFAVDAKHIHRLGYELVGKQETALSELIKNAYDADATEVRIDFKDYDEPGGTLVISDDGHGMTEEVIRNAWMRLSTNDKEESPISPKYGRSRAGRKGIGRFAVERLGKRLVLETKVSGKDYGIRVKFNWDEDFYHGRDLTQISYQIERFPKPESESGTSLIIEDLRDKWSHKFFERVWKSVLLLQPPFETPKPFRDKNYKRENYKADPGFKVYINGRLGDEVLEELSLEKTFIEQRLAEIKGKIDSDGNGHFYLNSGKLDLKDEQKSEDKFWLVGNLEFEASYFIYRSDLITGISLRQAEDMGYKYGGIRIYRDGFRILPYGEPHDDWLKLAYDTGRRNLLIPANNSNFFGHVELSSEKNSLFEETSGREGLIENEAYEELQKFVRTCLEWAALRIASARGRKQTAGQKGFVPEPRKPSESTKELIEELKEEIEETAKETLQESPAKKEVTVGIEKLERIQAEQESFEQEVGRRQDEHIQYEAMLRILASLGISISVFSHEVRGAVTGVNNALLDFRKVIRGEKTYDKELLSAYIDKFDDSLRRLHDISHYILTIISHSSAREKKPLALESIISSFTKEFRAYLNTRGISFDMDVSPPFLRTAPMHRSEIDSVLFNFLTNAVKSMERANSKERKIKISAKKYGKYALLSFQDTGGGVPPEIADKIFDAFFTTSQYKGDEIAGPGSGLGLKIVSDIAEANGGYVELAKPEEGYNCCFNFAVPIYKEQL